MEKRSFYNGLFCGLVAAVLTYIICRKKGDDGNDPRLKFVFHFPNQLKVSGQKLMARIALSQTISAEVELHNRLGGPAKHEAGTAVWTSSDESVATVEANPENELQAVITPVAEGVAQISVALDADRDAGETRTLTASGALEVVADEAETMELKFGEPQDTTGGETPA